MVKEGPTSLAANIKGTLHTKHETCSTDYNIKLEFNLIWDLNPDCEVAKTVSKGKLFHNGMTLGKKEAE